MSEPPTMFRGETWVGFFYRYAEWAGGQMSNARTPDSKAVSAHKEKE